MRYKKRPKPVSSDFTILYDDREKQPWLFLKDRWPMEKKRLKVGDYTIKGFENKIAIEKKSGLAELFMDLTAANRPRFGRFLRKLSKCPVKCIIVEESLTTSIIRLNLFMLQRKSKNKSCLTDETIYWWCAEIVTYYGIPIIFASRAAVRRIVPIIFESASRKAQEL